MGDTRELRTAPHDAALPVLFIREQTQMEGFEPLCRHTYFIPNVLFIHLSLLCFKARRRHTQLQQSCRGERKKYHAKNRHAKKRSKGIYLFITTRVI